MKALEYRRTTEDTVYIGLQDSTWNIAAINPIINGILKRGTVHTNVDASSIREIDISAPIDAATGETYKIL